MIAVTGATGQLGRLVIAALKHKGAGSYTVALARNPEKAADLGVEVRIFDYDRPETLNTALVGIETLLMISASEVGKRARQHKNVIDAAKAAGVTRIVYTSLLNAETSPIGLAEEHRQTEAMLKASGIPYTILRNPWYTENYTGNLGGAIANGAIIGSAGEGKLATASRADLAEAAANATLGTGHENRIYELGGAPYTLSELAAEVARQTGKPVTYNDLPQSEYANILKSFGLPDAVAEMISQADAHAANGALFNDSDDLEMLLGQPATSLADAVKSALA
jgi:NAD(P)H dehydrogenase (quinone)